MNQLRIIKKYPNRRLYDTEVSRYITLDEVKELVIQQIKFKIIDARTEQDMTNYVLLQIISEQEAGHSPIFTTEILQNMIRFYGNPLQKTMRHFLEDSFSQFSDQKSDITSYFQKLAEGKLDYEGLTELTKRNWEKWQSTMKDYFSSSESKSEKKKK